MKQVSISKFGILMRQLKNEDFPLEVTREGKVIFYVFKEIPGADNYEVPDLGAQNEVSVSPDQSQTEVSSPSAMPVCQFSTDCNAPSVGEYFISYGDDLGNPVARKMYLCFGHSQLQVKGVSIKKVE